VLQGTSWKRELEPELGRELELELELERVRVRVRVWARERDLERAWAGGKATVSSPLFSQQGERRSATCGGCHLPHPLQSRSAHRRSHRLQSHPLSRCRHHPHPSRHCLSEIALVVRELVLALVLERGQELAMGPAKAVPSVPRYQVTLAQLLVWLSDPCPTEA